ncbi:MAG TPA: GNAT family N-acetyltransferase [Puia sp.]|nr:GNAT family N-acetyltransferase [Puia sp.]
MAFPEVLQDADSRQLEQAAAFNHQQLFRKEALTLGGSLLNAEGLSWTSGNSQSPSMVAFPGLTDENAGRNLDELMSFYLKHPPKGAGCWSLDPPSPSDLGVRLLARGFQPGWRPRWMALDLTTVRAEHPYPNGLIIKADNDTSLVDVKNLPYAHVIIPAENTTDMPGQWVRFVATLHGKVVGHSVVFLTSGQWGAAGIYHVGVVPRARHKGVGKAVTLAACLYARDKGYRYAVLNSTGAGQRTYEQLGFTVTGDGWTWWLVTERFLARPPSPQDIQLAEAIGRGDQAALAGFPKHIPSGDNRTRLTSTFQGYLNQPLCNGLTLMQLAVHCRQPLSAEWLAVNGAAYTVLDAWDIGWKDRARRLLQKDPRSVDHRYGEWDKTLLHFAVERNDEELVRLALSARPDLRLKDNAYQSTALDWAKHFGHQGLIELILSAR